MLRKKTTASRLFQVCCENMSRNLPTVFGSSVAYPPTIRVLFKSVCLVVGKLRFYSRSGHTKDFKNSIRSFPPGARLIKTREGLNVCELFVMYVL